jgi:ankyrin repeat protein
MNWVITGDVVRLREAVKKAAERGGFTISTVINSLSDEQGRLLIHYAAQYGMVKVLNDFLLDRKAYSSDQDYEDGLPVILNEKGHLGRTALAVSVVYKQEDFLLALLETGIVEVNAGPDDVYRDDLSWLPLHHAIRDGEVALASILMRARANTNFKTDNGEYPLHLACKRSDVLLAELCFLNCTAVTPTDNLGNTPAHYAAHQGSKAVLQLLNQKGSSLTKKNKLGWTPLEVCRGQEWQAMQREDRGLARLFAELGGWLDELLGADVGSKGRRLPGEEVESEEVVSEEE